MSHRNTKNTYWSSTMTSSCWVYCCAKRRARSFASELSRTTGVKAQVRRGFTSLWVCACVRFLPRVDKVEDTQSLGQGGSQALCVQDYVVMQESWVCVQEVHLCCCGLSDAGVTVAHCNREHTGRYLHQTSRHKGAGVWRAACSTGFSLLPCWTLLMQSR